MMREDGSSRFPSVPRIFAVLITTVSVSPLTGCGDGSTASVKQPPLYTIVNASDVSQAPRSLAAKNHRGWPPVEFEPANLNFGIVPRHTNWAHHPNGETKQLADESRIGESAVDTSG